MKQQGHSLTISSSALGPAPVVIPDGQANSDAFVQGFVQLLLASCLLLQRFALPLSEDLRLSVATPLVLGSVAWGLLTGKLMIDRNRAILFLALVVVATLSTVMHFLFPLLSLAPRTSIPSLINWLLLTAFAVVTFRQPLPEKRFFQTLNVWLGFIAVAGILQFFLQFVGASLFGFYGHVPDQLLLENPPFAAAGYATDQTLDYYSVIKKANGFFLLEPSIFAQFMAVGIMVEVLWFRRWLWLAVFGGGMLVSVSGTGYIVLAAFGVALCLGYGWRGLAMIVVLLAGTAVAFLVTSAGLPEVTQRLVERATEFSNPTSSGYERFISPFLMIGDVVKAAPWMPVVGIGPGTSEHLMLPYAYFVILTPVKIIVEFGVLCFIIYLALIVSAERTARQRILLLPILVLLLLTGGYHQTAPVLFPALLIVTVARLQAQ